MTSIRPNRECFVGMQAKQPAHFLFAALVDRVAQCVFIGSGNTRQRLRPAFLARYNAWSASARQWSQSSSSGKLSENG